MDETALDVSLLQFPGYLHRKGKKFQCCCNCKMPPAGIFQVDLRLPRTTRKNLRALPEKLDLSPFERFSLQPSRFKLANLSLKTKGILLVVIPLTIQFIFSVTLAFFEVEAEQAEREQRHSFEILYEVGAVERKVYQLVMEIVVFTTFRRTDSLAQMDKLRNELPNSFNGLDALVKGDPVQESNVKQYKKTVSDFLDSIRTIRDALAEGDDMYAAMQARRVRDQLYGASFVDKSYKIRFLEQGRLGLEHKKVYQSRAPIRFWIFIGLGFNTIAAVVGSVIFSLDLSKRIRQIIRNTELLTMGKQIKPPMPGKDEIARLDAVFHRMATEINEAVKRETALVENAADVIFSFDQNLQFVTVSAASLALWGYEPDDLVGMRVMTLVPKAGQDAANDFLKRVQKTSEAQEMDMQVLCQDGSLKDFGWSVYWSEGKKSYFCVAHDITERRKMERAKQDFVNMVSHDIRTPLSSMKTFLEMLEQGVYGDLNEAGIGKSRMVLGSVGRLVNMVNDLLDIEKMESGNLVLKVRSVPVDRIVEGSMEIVGGFAEQQGVKLECADLPEIEVALDEDRIVQVLQNLLINAIKFSPEGKAVTVAVTTEPDTVRFSVRDRGPGIKESDKAVLFERFSQTDAGDGKKRVGSGLGLAICKEIVKKHGGQVGVESTPGKGSEFWFEVPRG